jgi:hypothetical protein
MQPVKVLIILQNNLHETRAKCRIQLVCGDELRKHQPAYSCFSIVYLDCILE